MGRDPSGGSVEVKVHPRRDDSTVHPGRGSPPPRQRPSPVPSNPTTYDRDFRLFKRWFPWLVPTFVVANIVVFIVTILEKMGALEVDKVVHRHQVWRLVSCIWLHGGVVHVLANMLSLVFIGIRLEQEFGFVRIGFLYVVSGFGGSLLSALFIQSGISVGASGALFGLLGGMLSELLINWTIYANKLAALLTLVVIIVINLAVGILPHVDNFAHIGGFVSGFLLGFIFLIRPQFKWISQRNAGSGYPAPSARHKHKPYQYVLWVISFILLTAGIRTWILVL
ncbi:Rhomboid-like superfamily [Sesbania bispinosa]|nr:Rhomboid-like superfamily [Sesbania bispinosa]